MGWQDNASATPAAQQRIADAPDREHFLFERCICVQGLHRQIWVEVVGACPHLQWLRTGVAKMGYGAQSQV